MMHNYKSTVSSAFTIIELLVVIAIIGILAAITLVSYSGVSNRAIIATMQSDLSNASTALRLDHATTDNFPASLALANGGKGIAPSQSMDDIIYVPDNSSNPKNFCLQYKKGSNTYAVDSNAAPSKGVCLKNLITNSDFSDGTTGWTSAIGSSLSASSNVLFSTGNGASALPHVGQGVTVITNPGTHKIYAKTKVLVTNSSCADVRFESRTAVSGNGNGSLLLLPTINQWYDYSSVWIPSSDINVIGIRHSYVDAATANGKIMQVKYFLAVDLTASFGAGNEPSLAQMDTIMSNYPNSWFNITAKANL